MTSQSKSTNANFKLEKWLDELSRLTGDIAYLKKNNSEFLTLVKKWNNKKLEFELWNFTKRNYVSYMSMAIRRLCDNHKDSVSLWKLINDIQENSLAIKSSWFLKEWPDGEEETLFKHFFGNQKSVVESTVAKHKKLLEDTTKSITDRADQFEAHKDKNPKLEAQPNFNDIDKSVELICNLYNKYYYLLKQSSNSFS